MGAFGSSGSRRLPWSIDNKPISHSRDDVPGAAFGAQADQRSRTATEGANAWGLSLDVLSFGHDVAAGPWGVANDIVFE